MEMQNGSILKFGTMEMQDQSPSGMALQREALTCYRSFQHLYCAKWYESIIAFFMTKFEF
jgi:hypothetical protein